ncbi:RING-type domain-containing protein, partial [Psidium guajava]
SLHISATCTICRNLLLRPG